MNIVVRDRNCLKPAVQDVAAHVTAVPIRDIRRMPIVTATTPCVCRVTYIVSSYCFQRRIYRAIIHRFGVIFYIAQNIFQILYRRKVPIPCRQDFCAIPYAVICCRRYGYTILFCVCRHFFVISRPFLIPIFPKSVGHTTSKAFIQFSHPRSPSPYFLRNAAQ